jgi:hypothetical protein
VKQLLEMFAMDVEEFQWPTRLLSRWISPKPGLVEPGLTVLST